MEHWAMSLLITPYSPSGQWVSSPNNLMYICTAICSGIGTGTCIFRYIYGGLGEEGKGAYGTRQSGGYDWFARVNLSFSQIVSLLYTIYHNNNG